jgi:hypothetical protein
VKRKSLSEIITERAAQNPDAEDFAGFGDDADFADVAMGFLAQDELDKAAETADAAKQRKLEELKQMRRESRSGSIKKPTAAKPHAAAPTSSNADIGPLVEKLKATTKKTLTWDSSKNIDVIIS